MPKTNFVNGNPAQGIQGTVVTAEFLNAVNNHRHRGLNEDGDGAIDYAPDTGVANAYVIALSPALTAHVVGMPIYFKAANANTGASTIVIDALAAVPIKKNGNQALTAGDIKAGKIVTVVYDGTCYQIDSAISIPKGHKSKLVVKHNATTPASNVDISSDSISLTDSVEHTIELRNVNITVNIAISGAGGLDTGAEAASTLYYIWLIYNPTTSTVSGVFSTSSTSPTMPSGYTYKRLVGEIYNGGDSNFTVYYRYNDTVSINLNIGTVYGNASLTTVWTAYSLPGSIPGGTSKLFLKAYSNAGTTPCRQMVSPDSDGAHYIVFTMPASNGSDGVGGYNETVEGVLLHKGGISIYAKSYDGATVANQSLWVVGYELER